MKIDNIEGFKGLALISHLSPNFNMKVTGTDSTGKNINFSLKDIKLDHRDEPGLTVKDNATGEYVQVANNQADITSVERINSISIDQIDTQKKNITANQYDTPLLLKYDSNKISILPDFKGDYDKIASLPGKKFGKYDPIQTLLNTTNLLNEVDKNGIAKAVTLDYETSGLPESLSRGITRINPITNKLERKYSDKEMAIALDQLPDDIKTNVRNTIQDIKTENPKARINNDSKLGIIKDMYKKDMNIDTFNALPTPIKEHILGDMFRPVEVSMQHLDITKEDSQYKFNRGEAESIFLKPNTSIETLTSKFTPEYLEKDLNSTDAWLARNYAKYDNGDFAKNIQVSNGKVFFENSDYTLTDSELTTTQYAENLKSSTDKVINHMTGKKVDDTLEAIMPRDKIKNNIADFMVHVAENSIDENNMPITPIGHNYSNAELPWTEDFLNKAKLHSRSVLRDATKEKNAAIEDVQTTYSKQLSGLRDSRNTVDFRIKDYEQRMDMGTPQHGLSISPTEQESSKRVIWAGEDISDNPVKLKAYNEKLGTVIQDEDEYKRLLGRRDELDDIIHSKTVEMNVATKAKDMELSIGTDRIRNDLKLFDMPLLKDGIDTLQQVKMIEPGRTDNRLSSLSKDMDIQSIGDSHLANVDTDATSQIFEKLVNHDNMKGFREAANAPLEVGDIIVKHNTDSNGVQFNKGMYELLSKPTQVEGGVKLDFRDLTNKENISVVAPNMGTFNRDASRNWLRFKPHQNEMAQAVNNEMIQLDSLRTLDNAMSNSNVWSLYKSRAKEGGNQGIVARMTTLKTNYDSAINKSITNAEKPLINGIRSFGEKPYTDMEHFVLTNYHKFSGDNFANEMVKYSKPISERRMKEFEAVGKYIGSDEGQLVEKYLNAAQDRLNAKVINKDQHNAFVSDVKNKIKNIKGADKTNMVEIKNNITLGDVTGDMLVELGGGGKDNLKRFFTS